jgi:hypothetical protein
MSFHIEWPFGLCQDSVLPPRAALDHFQFRRPNYPDMELAEPLLEYVGCYKAIMRTG